MTKSEFTLSKIPKKRKLPLAPYENYFPFKQEYTRKDLTRILCLLKCAYK